MATIDDLAPQFVTLAAAERDKIAFRMIVGGVPAEDVSENLETVDELDARVACAIRNSLPHVRDLPIEEQAAAIAKASADAFDKFLT